MGIHMSLSEFWRVKKSYDRNVEMRYLLDGLHSFITMMADQGDIKVMWSRDSVHMSGATPEIKLSYLPINNAEAPFEGDRVDAIVGFAAHEAGHRLRSKDNIPINNHTNPFNTGNPLNPLSIYPVQPMPDSVFKLISNLLEDVYIDKYMYRYSPVLVKYIKSGRQWDLTRPEYQQRWDELCDKAKTGQLDKVDMLNLWIQYELYDKNTAEILKDFPQEALENLLKLAEITQDYCERAGLVDIDKLFTTIWDELSNYPDPDLEDKSQQDERESEFSDSTLSGTPASFGKSDSCEDDTDDEDALSDSDNENESSESSDKQESELGASDDKGKEDSEQDELGLDNGDEEEKEKNSDSSDSKNKETDPYEDLLTCVQSSEHEIPESVLEEFRQAVSLDREDITQDLRDELTQQYQLPQQTHSGIIMEKAAETVVFPKPDEMSKLVNQLFEFRRRRHSRWSRGTEDGRLSQSRLHRAAYDTNHIHERKEIKDSLNLGVCLLVDASSSVTKSWPIIERIVEALALGLEHKKGIKICAIAYQSVYDRSSGVGNVQLTRLYESGNTTIGKHKSDGNTPTVSALLATPMIMNRLLGHPKDKLIIHVTDGAAGDEESMKCTVKEAVDIIRKKYGLDIYCFGIGGSSYFGNSEKFKIDYNTSYTNLDTYEQLPEALKNLLRDILVR